MRSLIVITALVSLSACAAGSSATYLPPSATVSPPEKTFRAPSVRSETGLESIVGNRASALLSRLGEARIDLSEGDSRKLQFAGATCILDIYLYPLKAGSEPIATHIEARKRQGGGAVDKAGCLAEVQAR